MTGPNPRHASNRAAAERAPMFILSAPRTGSTLLRCILDTHPDLHCPGELRLGPIIEYLASSHRYTDDAVTTDRASTTSFRGARRLIEAFMGDLCRDVGKPRWCEKTPLNAYHIAFIHATFPEAFYVCLHRQPLDAIRSTIQGGLMEHAMPTWKYSDQEIVNIAVERWCDWTQKILAFERVCPEKCIRVKYEQLVSAPHDTINQVLAFAHFHLMPCIVEDAFATRHADGIGDFKFVDTVGITRDRIGDGLTLDVSGVPSTLRHRVVGLMDALEY